MTDRTDPLAEVRRLAREGRLAEAEQLVRGFLKGQPRQPDVLRELAVIQYQQGAYREAEASAGQAIAERPDSAAAHAVLGLVRWGAGKLDAAYAAFHRALQLQPDHLPALNNLSLLLMCQGKLDEAIKPLRSAVRIAPNDPVLHNSLGLILKNQGKLDAAVTSFQKALDLRPNYATAHYNLAFTRLEQGQLDAAMAGNARAIKLDQRMADARYMRAFLWLLQGDFEQGWPEYEYRWQTDQVRRRGQLRRHDRWRLWDGGTLDGKTILLYTEQGLGDVFQFVRYAPLVKERGGRVLLECQPRLVRILSRCPGIDRLVPRGEEIPEPVDCQAPLLSLPGLFKTRANTIPADAAYLFADPERIGHWRERLASGDGFRIGIAWQGSQEHVRDRVRSIPLAQFAPLAAVPGVRLISLQKGPGAKQLAELDGRFSVDDLAAKLDETAGGFVDTAAVMTCLDLVISCDSAIAHLAGGLGIPVWVALNHVPDWRWQLDRDDSPWYSTMRLFRQARPGDWRGVFEAMAGALVARTATGT